MAEVDVDVVSGRTPEWQSRQSELRPATPEHIELLLQAGIVTYAQLREYRHNPPQLLRELGEVNLHRGLYVDLPSLGIIEQWLLQALHERPGTVITQVSARIPEAQRHSELQAATPEHIELLLEASIETYGQLRGYNPTRLVHTLRAVSSGREVDPTLYDFNTVERWILQATNELPGTIIIKPVP